ncbi:MAG TPA: 2-hydroxyacid dehydrogenase [Trueperaceae bacterium]
MKPEILVIKQMAPAETMAALEESFECHHLWRVPAAEREKFVSEVAQGVRGVATTGGDGISRNLMERLPNLEIVAVYGVGVDAVDLDAARELGVEVSNTPDVLTEDVADLAVTLLLAASRSLCRLDGHVRSGDWEEGVPLAMPRSVRGKTAGILGLGRIGRAVASRLSAFGMNVRYYQPRPKEDAPVPRVESLLELARMSDYLVVCAPARPETLRVVDASVLEALGSSGVLVNIARGSLVDESALIDALRDGRLGGAALDVFADEPHVPEELRKLENVILTPHIGSFTFETRQAMGRLVVENLKAHFEGRGLVTPVD